MYILLLYNIYALTHIVKYAYSFEHMCEKIFFLLLSEQAVSIFKPAGEPLTSKVKKFN